LEKYNREDGTGHWESFGFYGLRPLAHVKDNNKKKEGCRRECL